MLNNRYVIREVRGSSGSHAVYLAEDLYPVKMCPACRGVASDADEIRCTYCGADLSEISPAQLRYLVQERDDPAAFSSEGQLLQLDLRHPGLLLPVAVFVEAPHGPKRAYRVMPEFSPPLVKTVPGPRDLAQTLSWGVSLAKALAYLHQHDVALGSVDIDHVSVDGDRAWWSGLTRVTILSAEERASIREAHAVDVQKLATLLVQLGTGRANAALPESWPDALNQLITKAHREPAKVSAAEFAVMLEHLLEQVREPKRVTLVVGQCTDVGSIRSVNEDTLLSVDLGAIHRLRDQAAGLFLVADGMGGHDAGDVASQLTARTIGELTTEEGTRPISSRQLFSDPAGWLLTAVRQANQAVYEERMAAKSDMGTTLVAALVMGARATIANVGDSRCYLLSNRGITQVTVDHSLVERLVATGQITREEAAVHPQRHVIYRVIGDRPEVEIDLFEQPMQVDEALLLCSDGLSGMVSDETIWRIWMAAASPQDACIRLVAAANRAGGEDNITAVIVQVRT
ncbi:MAG: Stp1/IreP family PP2C-type Ser/Thr phosphatase [Anaerolineae bacterium]